MGTQAGTTACVPTPSASPRSVDPSLLECAVCLNMLAEPVTIGCGHTFCRTCLVRTRFVFFLLFFLLVVRRCASNVTVSLSVCTRSQTANLSRSNKKCPMCRSPCHVREPGGPWECIVGECLTHHDGGRVQVDAQVHPENIVIASLLRSLFPDAYVGPDPTWPAYLAADGVCVCVCVHTRYTARIAETVAMREGWRRTLPIFFYNDPLVPASPLHLHLFEMRYRIMIRRIMESNRQFLYLPNFSDYLPHAVWTARVDTRGRGSVC